MERSPRTGGLGPYPVLLLNSVASYLIGLLLIQGLHSGVTVLVASAYHIPITFDLQGLRFPISNYSTLWTADAIRMIFVSGPAACLLAGFAFAGWSLSLSGREVVRRDLFFWIAFHGINLALGSILAGVLTSSGFAWFAKWVYMNETARFFIALLALFALGLAGILFTPIGLRSAPSLWYIRGSDRPLFYFSRFLVPWLMGSLIMLALRLPVLPLHDLILLGTPLLLIASLVTHSRSLHEQDLEAVFLDAQGTIDPEDPRAKLYAPPLSPRIRWCMVLLALWLIAAYRSWLSAQIVIG
ncbi:MAG TPA: hypothetical protein P5550_02975 [Bacteroidales bacterium]|nr:hypothetical protein [Bacteroidales bacterium]HRZ76840.1 hypothetical protein [Bacteroidales bacterium]